ncbi:MAG: cyclic pyranopterin monophosphate synthase MoaC [Actinomycetota bacterium]|jgi:cyclic pyranopterin phosphate synthase|nr:cyclic pyranopterin monophosphate synthase MoaC [Acidimicrobiaceae bacterium]MEE2645909.1 cyclic pyranopterin monophosphate synthase MoaC [Actinomycetota bacterium]|tara:strand:+ start:487 stop:960 length:474 start_codon:yes stop_codon:yes gene_type:complete
MGDFTHLDDQGRARMVDVGDKASSRRKAIARAEIHMSPETIQALTQGGIPKGDVLAVARVAGIQAAKKTAELIPLCHPLPLTSVTVEFEIKEDRVEIESKAETFGQTGVEMEALTACSVAALTIYDMCKALDRLMVIESVALWEKEGGKSGDWKRSQ